VALARAVLFRGAGIDTIWPQILALAVIGTAFFSLSLWRFRISLR
jgi:ABC-2 type transport system permease protein